MSMSHRGTHKTARGLVDPDTHRMAPLCSHFVTLVVNLPSCSVTVNPLAQQASVENEPQRRSLRPDLSLPSNKCHKDLAKTQTRALPPKFWRFSTLVDKHLPPPTPQAVLTFGNKHRPSALVLYNIDLPSLQHITQRYRSHFRRNFRTRSSSHSRPRPLTEGVVI
jgi:hypothetical protein